MARQARSEVTRRKIIDAAVDLFSERGYGATGLGDIIERAEMTRGAFYYHFDSKESLAAALIDESAVAIRDAFNVTASTAPALETMIHGVFMVADLVCNDRLVRCGMHLARAIGDFADAYRSWLDAMSALASRAQKEQDVRADLDPAVVAEVTVSATLGAELISNAISDGTDLADRLNRTWEVLLSAIATAESAPYFRQFLARESLRHSQPTLLI